MGNTKIIWVIITFFCLIPVQIWSLMQPVSTRFINTAATMTSLGQLSALIGTVLLSLTFFLSIRAKFIEKLFGELCKVYDTHHIIGTFSFLLLLFHPIFLAIKYATFSISSAVSFITPGTNWAINFGIFSIVLMILFLLFTFFINLKYEKWKLTHQLLGAAFLLAIMHIFLVTSDISRSLTLKACMIIFISMGMVSFLYQTVLNGWILRKNKKNKCNNLVKK
jgi:predicted ferric reductase